MPNDRHAPWDAAVNDPPPVLTDFDGPDIWEPGLGLRAAADSRVFLFAAAAAVLTDAAVRSGVATATGFALVVLVAGAMFVSGRVQRPQARGLVAVAPLFGFWLMVHTSVWLIPLDLVAAGGLLLLAASLESGGSLFDLSIPAVVARSVHAVGHGATAPAFFVRSGGTHGRDSTLSAKSVLQGLALAVPILVVLGVLLGSADAVFASFFEWWSPESVIEHGALLVVGAWGMVGLLRLASAEPARPLPSFRFRLGSVQATVILGSLVTLFAAFAAAQLVALSAGGRHVIETSGLTYAEYARSGFFQLLAVAVITLAILLTLRAVTDLSDTRASRRFIVLGEASVALILVIVFVAIRRLSLYEDAFGLTMLRLYSQVFAVWVGVVFVFLGAMLAGVERHRAWLPPAAAAAGLAILLALNVLNPEAIVVEHNVDHAATSGRFDPGYVTGLSDDAVPALVDALPRLDPGTRQQVRAVVCTGHSPSGFNLAAEAADDARSRICPPTND